MAFDGTLIRIGDNRVTLPTDPVVFGSYQCNGVAPREISRWTDLYGDEHFVVAPNAQTTVKFTLKETEEDDLRPWLDILFANMQDAEKLTIRMQCFDFKSGDYIEGLFQMENPQFTIKQIDTQKKTIKYNETDFTFTQVSELT